MSETMIKVIGFREFKLIKVEVEGADIWIDSRSDIDFDSCSFHGHCEIIGCYILNSVIVNSTIIDCNISDCTIEDCKLEDGTCTNAYLASVAAYRNAFDNKAFHDIEFKWKPNKIIWYKYTAFDIQQLGCVTIYKTRKGEFEIGICGNPNAFDIRFCSHVEFISLINGYAGFTAEYVNAINAMVSSAIALINAMPECEQHMQEMGEE